MRRYGHSSRIDAMKSYATGEIAPPHRIGETRSGRELFRHVDGWYPVCRHTSAHGEEYYVPTTRLRQNRDGNYYVAR